MCMVHGDAFVAHSRNRIVDAFLKSDHEYLFFIDDDMLVPFGDAKWFRAHFGHDIPEQFAGFHAVDRLLSHKKTLIGGLYFGRNPTGAPMYGEALNPEEAALARRAPMDVVKETRWVATGCMLIHRSVFLDIEEKFPRLARGRDGTGSQCFSTSEHRLFADVENTTKLMENGPMTAEKCVKTYGMLIQALAEARRNSSLGMGEDVQFCIRAAQAGHQPYVDMGLVCGHIGSHVWGPHNTRRKENAHIGVKK